MEATNIWFIESSSQAKLPLVNIKITGTLKKETKNYVALIDSGATRTALSKKIGEDLKFAEVGDEPVNTPTNKDVLLKKVRIKFNIIGTDNSEFEEALDAIQLKENLSNCDILVGLDILQHAYFEYKGKEKEFTLSFKKR